MNDYILISDYMNIEKYRCSFNRLASNTFGLDFEDWYQKGLFYNRYICYSYIHKDKVVSNVSINKMNLVVEGQNKKAIQLGTVMTHSDYRNQGLAASLIKHILKKYENECDIIYLFANDSVLDFYPKFGFRRVIESAYEIDAKQIQRKESFIRKIEKDNEEDCRTIMRLAENRKSVSQELGIFNDKWPLLVYCFNMYRDDLYYLDDEDCIVIAKREDGTLHLYDILSLKEVDLDRVIEKITLPGDKKIEFHFIPELSIYKASNTTKERQDDTLFIMSKNTQFKEVLFPMTSHT